MCGILGAIPAINSSFFSESLKLISHRGPNGLYTWHADTQKVSLGHARLAIIDKSDSGIQPMKYENLHIVFNGEIYNYLEVKEELMLLGYKFTSNSDSEVILASYLQWKEMCFERFNGMWALAIWNEENDSLLLSRDRFGEKPLYYTHRNNQFVFASEMKALIPYLSEVELAANFNELSNDLFSYESGSQCLIKGIERFPAAHIGIFNNNQLTLTRYWETKDHLVNVPDNYQSQVENFKSLFLDAVKIRMRSDVPLGNALSGGTDSSCVAVAMNAIAQKVEPTFNHNWQNFFVATFPGTDLDETAYANAVAKKLDITPHYLTIDPRKALTELEDFYYKFEEIYITSPVPMMQTYKAMSDSGIHVTLDGHGADELFCGYDTFFLTALKDCGLNPFAIHNILSTYNSLSGGKAQFQKPAKTFREYLKWNTGSEDLQSLLPILKTEIRKAFASEKEQTKKMDTLTQNLYQLFHHDNLPTLLRNYDRYSMANGVEIRMPFLDHRLVAYTFSLPWQSKIRNGYTKAVLRDAMKPFLPNEIYKRKSKMGFQTPIVDWLKGPWRDYFLAIIHSTEFAESKLIDAKLVREKITRVIEEENVSYREGELAYAALAPFLWEKFVFNRFKLIHQQFQQLERNA